MICFPFSLRKPESEGWLVADSKFEQIVDDSFPVPGGDAQVSKDLRTLKQW